MSTVYSLLMSVVLMCILLCPSLGNNSGGIGSVGLLCFLVCLVNCTCCRIWTICLLIVSLQVGHYLVAFWYVSPVHESKFPALITLARFLGLGIHMLHGSTGSGPLQWADCRH